MKYFCFVFTLFTFLFFFLGQVGAHHDGDVQETVTLTITDTSLPEGPDPTNWDKDNVALRTYKREEAKSWTLTLNSYL